jgi:hypothetical protein
VLVAEFLRMERSLGDVVMLVPSMYGMAAMESLPDKSDFWRVVLLALVIDADADCWCCSNSLVLDSRSGIVHGGEHMNIYLP